MGFFSFLKPLVELATPVVGALIGTAAAPGVTAALGALTGDTPAQTALKVAAAGGPGLVTQTALSIGTAQGALAGITGNLRRRTIVQTFNPITGAILKSEIFKGAPAVMNSDVAAANRLNRQLSRLNKKQPRKTVKQSTAARLKEEVVESALREAIHNGHNGHVLLPAPRCP